MNKKFNKMNNQTTTPNKVVALAFILAMGFTNLMMAQNPNVTVRLANPTFECAVGQYCLDVEFQTDQDSVELFGMNVRFFYDDTYLELDSFTNFQGGYGLVAPDPPAVLTSPPGFGTTFFGFPAPGIADWVNGAIQLVDNSQPPIYIDTVGWTQIFQICFSVEGPIADSTNFCPPIVWDLELNPANGGYLGGDDGVVITVVADPPAMSGPALEGVVQFNWMYTGDGTTQPYGVPVENECISLLCAPTIVCPADITIDCAASTDTSNTGSAIATVPCLTTFTIDFTDDIVPTQCDQSYTINRTWIAVNDCNEADTCVQVITVIDTTAPVLICPPFITIECTESTDPSNTGMATASDACDPSPEVTYIDIPVLGLCPQEYTIDRIWFGTDSCGNTSILCRQEIQIIDSTPPVITCPSDLTIECSDPLPNDSPLATDNCSPTDSITFSFADITCDNPVLGFTDIYDINNWTPIALFGGSVIPMGDSMVMLESPDGNIPCPMGASVLFQIVIPSTGQLIFDWEFTASDVNGPLYDPFGYNLNGTFIQLTDDNGADMQSGTATVNVTAGDVFAFEQNTIDCILGEGASTVVEFFACIEQTEPVCTQLVVRTHTATDQCGNSSNCVQTIFLEDTTIPTITCPANITIECTDSILPDSTGFAIATDNCDTLLTVTYADITASSMTCAQEYSITRTWTATDNCGNSASCTQSIIVDDSTPPTITLCPANVTIECDESTDPLNTGLATATDNCDTAPVVTYSDATIAGTCPQEYTINRTWSATDACGNISTCAQIVEIEDTTAPTITTCPANVTIECDESTAPGNTGLAVATDNCDLAPVVTFSDATVAGACPQEYSITRTWSATDACGNSSTCSQSIVVEDTTVPTITLCPANVTIECDESTDPLNTGLATATDNCDPAPVVTYSDATVAGACPLEYTITRTWTATDACGNGTNCSQIITVDDSTPPTITTCAANITIECDESTDPSNTGLSSATDNCDIAPEVTYSDATVAGACPQEYTITRTWTATDTCGNSSTCSQIITVDDSIPPTITACAANITIECDESTDPSNTGLTSATDNCDLAPVVTYSDATVGGACPQEYTITRTWTATDACGNGTNCTQIITVDDSTPPTITDCPASITIECDESTDPLNTGLASATDNCDTAPVVTYNDATIAGACPQEYSITRTWTATDACGNSSTCSQSVVVEDTTVPTITFCPLDVTVECDESTDPLDTGMASATDNCDPAPVVTYSDATVGGQCPQEYTITRTWTATDACGNGTNCTQIITVDDSTPPTITICAANITIECDESTDPSNTGLSSATDNCDPAPVVTYNDATTEGACPQEYTITRTWTATDACGNGTNCTQIITVDDSTPPTITTCAADITIECDESTDPANTGLTSATDNCDLAPVVTYSDATVGGACPQEYTITRTWTATDACGNGTNCTQIITVDDSTPPTITDCPASVTIECDESTDPLNTGLASATDNCDTAPVVTYNDATIAGACPQEYSITRTWTATDACGNSSTCSQSVVVEDTTVPTITFCPLDVTVECDESTDPLDTGMASATDNCDPAPVVTYSDATVGGQCPQEYTITRTWTATDACGNGTNCIQVITVDDSTPPTITTCAADITIECDESTDPSNTGLSSATDNCDTAPVVTYNDATTEGACPQEYTITRTWTATDACGNGTNCTQIITVDDSTPPTITECPANLTIECDESTDPADTGLASATDNCDAAPVVTYADLTFGSQICIQEYTINRTWTATDACGNSTTCVQVIVIDDSTPPAITCPADVTIECDEDPSSESNGLASATDNCSINIIVSEDDVTIEGDCPQEYTITRTWTALDECGNSSTCIQTIVVEDTTPPTVACPEDITIDCNDSTDPDNTGFASATDNCDNGGGEGVPVTFDDITIEDGCPEIIERTWTATDACGNVGTCVQLITIDDTAPPTILCPLNVTVECASDVPPILTGGVTVSDNCGLVTVTHMGDDTTNMTCENRFDITRVYLATDECGNTATCAQVIIVFDDTPPTLTCPAPLTVSCASLVPAPAPGSITASDNCAGLVTVTFGGDVITNQTCADRFTLTRTYIATDVCGNSATCTQVITVFDATPPTITCPGPVTVSCASEVPTVNPGSVTTSDNCGGAVTVTFGGDVITNQTCINRFTVTRTYLASDACGNSTSCTQVITVFDNTPPVITCPADITIDFGSSTLPPATGNPTGSDNCGGTPTFAFTDVTVAGPCEEEFTINRTWTATDACGLTSTCVQVIFVDGDCIVDLSLTKELISPAEVEGGDNVTFEITIFNEGEVTVGAVVITDYIPLGFTLNDPDWTPGNSGSTGQSASITLSVANGGLDANGLNPGEFVTVQITLLADLDIAPGLYFNTAEITFIFDMNGNDISDQDIDSDPDNVDTNDPPGEDDIDIAAICVLPDPVISGDGYVCPGEVTTYFVSQYDPNFTYEWNLNGGGTIIEDNGSNIVVEWQDEPGGPFQIVVNVILGDNCSTIAFFNVYIQGVETLACNDNVQISLGEDCTATILSGMILEGEAEGNNNYFVIITDENGNVIPDATLTSEHIGQCFTVTVANECNDQSCWGTICVEDKIPPVIECTDVTVSCGTSLEPVFAPTVTGTAVESVTTNLPIGPNAGTITTQQFILDVPANAVITDVDITIDLAHTWVGDLTVQLISPAGTTVLLVDQLCGAVNDWDNVTFDDQAGLAVSTACNPIPPALSGSVIPQGALSDINGQSAVGAWTLVITDQVGGDGGTLNFASLDVDYYLAVPSAPFASDACGEVELTYTDTESGDACEALTITRTWTATDGSGNTATCIQTITITPLTLGNIDFPEAYVGVCGESVHPDATGWPTVDGNPITDENNLCNIFVGYWDKELAECGGGRKIVRTWTVLDWCTVDFVEAVQVIKLVDDIGPDLTCPADFTVGTDFWYCYANVSVPKPIAIDDCSDIATYSLTSSSGIVVSFGNNYVINGLLIGTHTVTWTVTDECGNSSTCSFEITVIDDVVPVANCDQHTIVSLTNDGPGGITLVPASVFDDGSYDNCGPVTFRARRMDSCIDFDWTTEGACIDDVPGGIPPVNSRDRGTVHRPCVPFACCDVGAGPVMVELEVTDAAGNVNYCMIEATVQDKISPFVECPPDIIVSCDFWFNVEEGTFVDAEGNNNGSLDEDPLSSVFGNMYDAFRYDESIRNNIIINDPGNDDYNQPHNWGIDGWADDNCEVNLQVRVRVIDDCSGGELPGNAPDGAVKLIERRFSASDGNDGVAPGTCTQRIWVVDYDPFYITDNTCNNSNSQDGVIWPCDVLLSTCPEDLGNTGEPTVFDDACSLIGVTYEDTRFDFVDGACFKILREWAIIDWCQYNSQTGEGLWHYTQVIKVHDEEGPEFVAPCIDEVLCVADEGVTLPDNNQAFLGEDNPLASSCSVHLNLSRTVHETCSDAVQYDVKIYPFNGTEYILIKPTTTAVVDENNDAVLSFDTRQSTIQSIRLNGLPYNSQFCGDHHRILWSVEDGCGNWSHCEYLIRLEDCKQPSPVCINGLSTVVMPVGGQVTVWAKDFNASSFDDCTPSEELLYSFSGDTYAPSFTYTCENVPAFNVELSTQIWVADGGTDDNCNGQISWSERNKDYCTTTIVITDNAGVCDTTGGSILAGEILTDDTDAVAQVSVELTSPGHIFPQVVTTQDGKYTFPSVPLGDDYMISPERNDDHRNGVSTLDLVRIQKHLLGKELFTSPYQYIAADANNTETISAIDLIEIRKLILGIYSEFPNNKSWRFVEKGYPMDTEHPWPFNENIQLPDLATDSVMHNDFVGVKIGDVNNTAKANIHQILPRSGRRVLNVQLDAPDAVEAGQTFDVRLRMPESVEGLQWTLETEGLTFESIASETMKMGESHIGMPEDGVITMSWNAESEESRGAGQVIHLRFMATESGSITQMIRLTSLVTEAEAYTTEGEILDVKLRKDGIAPEFALYQNTPNPWNAQTSIGFDLPKDAEVKLTIFDATGKVVRTVENEFKAGYNTIVLNAHELTTSGVMYYRLESGEYSASKKMVLIK